MSNMCIGNKKGKLSLKSKVLLGVLALAVIAGLGTGVYAASAASADKLLSGQTSILDPFTLQSTRLSVSQRVSVSESLKYAYHIGRLCVPRFDRLSCFGKPCLS